MQGFLGDGPTASLMGRGGAWAVPVDIEETDDAYIIELDLPNVRREDVNIELNDNEPGAVDWRQRRGKSRGRCTDHTSG